MRRERDTTTAATSVLRLRLLVLLVVIVDPCASLRAGVPVLGQRRPAAAAVRSLPTMSLALPMVPTCAPTGIWSLAAQAGAIGLAGQLGLTALFRASDDPVLSDAAGYTAHQAVAFLLMVFVTALGLLAWLNPPLAAATAAGRLLAPSDGARWLGAMLLGMLVAWDIPTSYLIPRLRKADVLAHHVGMAAVALVGSVWLPTHYGFYYMGVAELSSIPLTFYDLMERAVEGSNKDASVKNDAASKARAKRLRGVRDVTKTIAAVAFILVRAIDFTRVTLTRFVPDAISVLASAATATRFRLPIQFMVVSSVGFVALQLYWLSLYARISLAQSARERRRKAKGGTKAAEEKGAPDE